MRSIRTGDRGPAVEDVQRRLLVLGYDLGRTGVDGVFLGRTCEAVNAFQQAQGLTADGTVGDITWSALVDATFTLGDRMLYLRLPHFHGADVLVLQKALNALGFACGETDGIFGAFTERALREFQRNAGHSVDGIVGPEAVSSINALRHVWEGKDTRPHSQARTGPARAAEVLGRVNLGICGEDAAGNEVAGRVVNLAAAANPESGLVLLVEGDQKPPELIGIIRLFGSGTASAVFGRPVVHVDDPAALVARLITAVTTASGSCFEIGIEFEEAGLEDEAVLQRNAVMLLDAVCAVFDR